jgi:hypothetical protein
MNEIASSVVPNLAVRAVVEFARIPSPAMKEGNSGEFHCNPLAFELLDLELRKLFERASESAGGCWGDSPQPPRVIQEPTADEGVVSRAGSGKNSTSFSLPRAAPRQGDPEAGRARIAHS